ncbi:plastocyanin/azurin family copper-binding protein [Halopenitus sp. H-Gu1]|uniref:plastocyanin/azurin family copper-binding protein n=1 Tax=Halopenitus sp. H-Gu1 TaxID=3242697 RepID=UPI00359DC83E
MKNESLYTRRRMLGVTGSVAVIGLAGCTGQTNNVESGSEATPTENDHQNEESGHDDEADEHDDEADEHDDGADEHDDGADEHDDGADEQGHDHDEGKLEEPSATAEVLLQTENNQHHFTPHAVWIEPGGTVTWTTESGHHDAVAYHPDNNDKPLRMPEEAAPWSTDFLAEEGATDSHTFEIEGVYDYYCTPHEHVGMVGTVIVGEPDPHDQPALEEPQSSLPDGAKNELADLGEKVNEALEHTH